MIGQARKTLALGTLSLALAPVPAHAAGDPAWTTGTRSVIYLIPQYADEAAPILTPDAARAAFARVRQFYTNSSGSRLSFAVTVPDTIIRMAHPYSYYNFDATVIADEMKANALALGIDVTKYDVQGYCEGKVASNTATRSWIRMGQCGNAIAIAHELGHSLGLAHANSLDRLWGSANLEYGDHLVVQGDLVSNSYFQQGWRDASGVLPGEFNPLMKAYLNWLAPSNFQTIPAGSNRSATSTTVRLYAHDTGGISSQIVGVRIPLINPLFLSFNQALTGSTYDMNGVLLHQSISGDLGSADGGRATLRVDAHPSTSGTLSITGSSSSTNWDSAVAIGETWTDPVSGVSITPLGKNGTFPESVDVRIDTMTVAPVMKGIGIAAFSVSAGQSVQLSLDSLDQFGAAMGAAGGAPVWSVNTGSITQSGLLTAPSSSGASVTVTAVLGSYRTSRTVTVGSTALPSPSPSPSPSASPSPTPSPSPTVAPSPAPSPTSTSGKTCKGKRCR
jgi:hypothetical protein